MRSRITSTAPSRASTSRISRCTSSRSAAARCSNSLSACSTSPRSRAKSACACAACVESVLSSCACARSSSMRAFSRSVFTRKTFRSSPFNSSRNFRYSRAVSDCSRSGSIRAFISPKMSSTRERFMRVFSMRRSASLRRARYFTMPAASSKIWRRSSLLEERISSTRPCPTSEYPSRPTPVSRNRSITSFNRQAARLIVYSLSPVRYTRRAMATSSYSMGNE